MQLNLQYTDSIPNNNILLFLNSQTECENK